jgi:hypothetical protein
VIAMYGYNTVIEVTNAPGFNKVFYGFSLGLGNDFNSYKRSSRGYLTIALIFPLRTKEVFDYIDKLKYHYVVFDSKLSPVTFSVGYRIKF